MIFECVNGVRPIRLSEATRQLAYDSLHYKYGRDTEKTPAVTLDNIDNFEEAESIDKYDIAVKAITEGAPIRICENEKISGAATLGVAIAHQVPALFKEKPVFRSISHLTVDFETVLKRGIDGIEEDILSSKATHTEKDKLRFLESCQSTVDSMRAWHKRYLDTLKAMPQYQANYENLLRVPFKPAHNFYEAVQSIWFTFAFIRLCGNWPGIGRIDWLLGDYLKKDLADGTLTLTEAREILAHFFIKGCEWIRGGERGSGDAQHYQNIVLSGIDGDGRNIENEVTYLVLDIIEELGISDFPISVRLNSKTSERLLARCASVVKLGGGVLAFYDEETVLKAIIGYGYPQEQAWKFANDGCWEIQIPGETNFNYHPFDALSILQMQTLNGYEGTRHFESFEELYKCYTDDLHNSVWDIFKQRTAILDESNPYKWKKATPCTVVSIFERGCIKKGLSYVEGGPNYNVISPHIGGYPDVMNSLYAIKKLVFDDKRLSFDELMQILKSDWEGNEDLRQYIKSRYEFFGNGNSEVDELGARLFDDFADFCAELDGKCGIMFPAGVSTFGRQLNWASQRLATPHGYKAGAVLAANCSPTPDTDVKGATAIIESYCKIDLEKAVTGAALDIRLLPKSVEGEDGTEAIIGLLRGFLALGGCFVQMDVVDKEVLREAQLHPESYQTLSVRVSGWNARFITLNRYWQDMVIDESK